MGPSQRWIELAPPSALPTILLYGVLRFDFPGYGGQKLQQISWEEWFKTFDARHLIFLYQEKLRDGRQSNFFRMDGPEREHE